MSAPAPAKEAQAPRSQGPDARHGRPDGGSVVLRQEQRNLQDRIGERGPRCARSTTGEVQGQRAANNGLFKKVRYNREMVNDGDIMVGLAEWRSRARALSPSVKQYGAKDMRRS